MITLYLFAKKKFVTYLLYSIPDNVFSTMFYNNDYNGYDNDDDADIHT